MKLSAFGLSLLLVGLLNCSSRPTARAPEQEAQATAGKGESYAVGPEPSAEELLAELERAEAELAGIGVPAVAPSAAGAPTPAAPMQAPATTGCERSCSAFASMKRASTALCRLAGSEDPRCSLANEKVSRASLRLQQANCQCVPTP
jgi:hypothetical protein